MATAERALLLPAEYLAIERQADIKSEYLDGQMFAMAGANRAHADIVANIIQRLLNCLGPGGCRPAGSDLRVQVTPAGPYTYPDVLVYYKDAVWLDDSRDTLTNPHVIFEVLSPRTERYDRGEKFHYYRRLESLTDYILVSQETMRIEHFRRHSPGHSPSLQANWEPRPGHEWVLTEIEGEDGILSLSSLPISLTLNDIYTDVELTSAAVTHLE